MSIINNENSLNNDIKAKDLTFEENPQEIVTLNFTNGVLSSEFDPTTLALGQIPDSYEEYHIKPDGPDTVSIIYTDKDDMVTASFKCPRKLAAGILNGQKISILPKETPVKENWIFIKEENKAISPKDHERPFITHFLSEDGIATYTYQLRNN